MTILVDGDSCPRLLLPVIDRACRRLRVNSLFVANRPVPLPESPWLTLRVCDSAAGSVDDALVQLTRRDDLAITRDTGLARRLLKGGATVISPHGHQFTLDNVAAKTSEAQAHAQLRSLGLAEASPSVRNFNQRQLRQFAAVFDRCLARLCPSVKVPTQENRDTSS